MAGESNVHYVVIHRPGPAWQEGVDFREQPGVRAHVGHYAGLLEQGKLRMGGPLLEQDRGGMMAFRAAVDQDEAEALAAADPAVESGLLTYEVLPWYLAMDADKDAE